jgi:type II secretory pathway component PulK
MRSSRIKSSIWRENGSTFIIVMWIAFGLVSIALYFGYAMSFELRASDNRVSGIGAEQAIEGAERYVSSILSYQAAYGTNGIAPDPSTYLAEAVPVGDSLFWLIGRDTNSTIGPGRLTFGMVDEASKININYAPSNILAGLVQWLPLTSVDLPSAVLDWRDTNSSGLFQTTYATRGQPYQTKSGPFETVDELRLIYGADMETLVGEDINRNGVLDANESDPDHNGQINPGLLEYITVYSREPNTYSNATARVSLRGVSSTGPLANLLQAAFGSTRAQAILVRLGILNAAGRPGASRNFNSPLRFYLASGMTSDEFGQIANALTTTNGTYIQGRVNVNTASAVVLGALPGVSSSPGLGSTLVSYRQSNPDRLTSVAWVADAIGTNNAPVLDQLAAVDCITTQTYQFTADVAALGPNGRGYRRVKFVFDTSSGTPLVVYRQDLTHLGWALGKERRESLVLAKATR